MENEQQINEEFIKDCLETPEGIRVLAEKLAPIIFESLLYQQSLMDKIK